MRSFVFCCVLVSGPIAAIASSQVRAALSPNKLASDSSSLHVPALGYLASDSPASVRPIVGAPGAVVLGDPIALPDGILHVAVAPGQSYALVEQDGVASLGVLPLGITTSGDVQLIPNVMPHADRIAFSHSGGVAAVYSSANSQAQIINGLASNPQLLQPISERPERNAGDAGSQWPCPSARRR